MVRPKEMFSPMNFYDQMILNSGLHHIHKYPNSVVSWVLYQPPTQGVLPKAKLGFKKVQQCSDQGEGHSQRCVSGMI